MLISLLVAATVLAGGDPDEVVTTAPRTAVNLDVGTGPVAPPVGAAAQEAAPHGLTTDQQIEHWLASRDPAAQPFSQDLPDADRQLQGQLSVTVGTGGYRDYGAAVSLPLGENGELHLSIRQVENGYYGYGWNDPWLDGPGYSHYANPRAAPDWRYRERDGTFAQGRPWPVERRP